MKAKDVRTERDRKRERPKQFVRGEDESQDGMAGRDE